MGLIGRIARSFEQFAPGPMTKTVEEQLRPLDDVRIGPYLRNHGRILRCIGAGGASTLPTMRWYHVHTSNAIIGCHSCTDHRRTLYNMDPLGSTSPRETHH